MSGAYTKINNNFFAHRNKEVIATHKTQAHVKRTGSLIWLQTRKWINIRDEPSDVASALSSDYKIYLCKLSS